MRLAKYLAHAGVASRRAAEELVFAGRVTLAGEEVRDPARDVQEGADLRVDGRRVGGGEERRVVWAVHKPAGVVSTAHDPQGRPTVVSLVKAAERLYPVGRLDADTTGLILLTNDGDLAHRLTHPSFEVPKTYRATVRRPPVREPALQALREGVELEDGRTAPAQVRRLRADLIELVIHEGKKRQVRRMCEAVGHRAERLERIAFGPLRLERLPEGQARRLTAQELRALGTAPTSRGAGASGGHPRSQGSARPPGPSRPPRPPRSPGPSRSSRPAAPSRPPQASGPRTGVRPKAVPQRSQHGDAR